MTCTARTLTLAIATVGLALAAGCGAPAAMERSQRLQLDAMVQYRDQMALYHQKVRSQLLAQKTAELDQAHAASLAQVADADGKVPVAVALEKYRKRAELEATFQTNVARLDREFGERQEAIGRAIDLAQGTLGLLADYSRLGSVVRSLFVKDIETKELVDAYLIPERSASDAGSPSEPTASGH
jgi:hypothetical protein